MASRTGATAKTEKICPVPLPLLYRLLTVGTAPPAHETEAGRRAGPVELVFTTRSGRPIEP
ncbi:hypothetical protein AB0O20_18540 [Streptomyces kronopolitis]|uniref:hypothetical protein n=1 Tax=Streptomyces kronopolitis TaxID=1612435 RepID=UPI00341AD777